MMGRLLDSWKYTWTEIWQPLDAIPNKPRDLFIQLYQTVLAQLKTPLSYADYQTPEMVERLNNPDAAKKAFRQIKGQDFSGEASATTFVTDVNAYLEELGKPTISDRYYRLVKSFLANHNLRYRLEQPFHLSVQLPWVYADFYAQLCRTSLQDPHLRGLMNDFEEAFDTFLRTRARRDLKTSIARASNYAEGIAAKNLRSANSNTLGTMAEELTKQRVWPHDAIRRALQELYIFCSDYPGIRHAGDNGNMLRPLEARDTIVVSILLLGFSAYMHGQVNFDTLID